MESVTERCFLHWKFNCIGKTEGLVNVAATRIQNLIRCSKIYGDGIHAQLEANIEKDPGLFLRCHKSCVSTYTSNRQTERHKRQHSLDETASVPPKVTRQSVDTTGDFDFQKHCLFCGTSCIIAKDPKNPSRWRPAYLYRELNAKKSVLEMCDK